MTTTRGAREYEALTGLQADAKLADLRARSPHMHHWLLNGAFAGPLADSRLSRRDRELATVAILASLGDTGPQLRLHLQAALRHGITDEELRALCEHVSVYAGFPRALNALAAVEETCSEIGLPDAVPVRFVQLEDHETALVDIGTGPVVVLVHALGLTWRMWKPIIAELAEKRRVIAYDVRGHGAAIEAPAPADLDVTANDLSEILHVAGVDAAHIVGLSYGGGIAQTFATKHPAAVLSLTLAATTDRPFESFEDRAAAVEATGTAAQVATSLARWFTPEALAENGAGVSYARECVLRGDPTQIAAAWRAFAKLDVKGRLRDFAAPTLILAGERDASTTPAVMRGIHGNMPGSQFREMPGAPHMPTLETPHLVLRALDDFLPRRSDS
jgi:3-oxoadipate enol-lactonase